MRPSPAIILGHFMTDRLPRDFLPLVTYAAGTDIGLRREENQDSFGLLDTELFRCFFVADGMGGAQGGAEASQLALASIRGFLAGEVSLNVDGVREAVEAANKTIFDRSSVEPDLAGMGTTLVGLGFGAEGVLVCNVGDSRAFRIRRGKIGRITQDHTLVQELVDSGTITEEQAERHPVAHMLTRSLGPAESVAVDCWMYPQRPELGDVYVLCSDGLYNLVSPLEIAEVVLFNEGHDAIGKLIDLANSAGGTDNITVVVIRVGPTNRVPLSEIAVERLPQGPYISERGATTEHDEGISDEESGYEGPHGDDSALFDDGRKSSGSFKALSGAFRSPDLWSFRTAARDSRNIIIGGAAGLFIFCATWLVKPEPSPVAPPRVAVLDRALGYSIGGLVSASLKANLPEFKERRNGELRSELELVGGLLSKRGGERSSSFNEQMLALRTQQNRHRAAILQLRQELVALLELRKQLPSSPALLLKESEQFEDKSPEVKAARAEASIPVWKMRQIAPTFVEANGRGDENIENLQKEVSEADKKLRMVLQAELERRIAKGLRDMRSQLGGEVAVRGHSELLERLVKREGGNDQGEAALGAYRTELVALLQDSAR